MTTTAHLNPSKNLRLGLLLLWLFLLAYGTFTVYYSSLDGGQVYDEPAFNKWGTQYLAHPDPLVHVDHPPLAMWLGSWPPQILQSQQPADFRLLQVGLYALSGLLICSLLSFSGLPWSAFVFSLFYVLDPQLKAMASLHVTDFPATAFFLLSVLCFWRFWRTSTQIFLGLCVLFLALAVSAKISLVFWGPFLTLALLWRFRSLSQLKWPLLMSAFIFTATCYAAFLGSGSFLLGLWKSLQFSFEHGAEGHITSLFGTYSNTGYRSYFLALILSKTTPLLMILCLWALALYLRNRALLAKHELFLFFLPSIFLLFLLSRSLAQVGYRYFLPGLFLYYLSAALVIGRHLSSQWQGSQTRKKTLLVLPLLMGIGLYSDQNTLQQDSYLSYFNFLTPQPTRNFSEANIDWNQGLPNHLQSQIEGAQKTTALFDFFLGSKSEIRLVVGASELVGFWGSMLSPHLRSLPPERVLAGHEIFNLSKNQLYHLMNNRSAYPPMVWETLNLKKASEPFAELPIGQRVCTAGQTLQTKAMPLFQELWFEFLQTTEALQKTETQLRGTHELQLPPISEGILFIESNLAGPMWINGVEAFNLRADVHPPILVQSWQKFRPNSSGNILRLETSPQALDPQQYFRVLLLWQECL